MKRIPEVSNDSNPVYEMGQKKITNQAVKGNSTCQPPLLRAAAQLRAQLRCEEDGRGQRSSKRCAWDEKKYNCRWNTWSGKVVILLHTQTHINRIVLSSDYERVLKQATIY